jgi:hypothetical protein
VWCGGIVRWRRKRNGHSAPNTAGATGISLEHSSPIDSNRHLIYSSWFPWGRDDCENSVLSRAETARTDSVLFWRESCVVADFYLGSGICGADKQLVDRGETTGGGNSVG